MNNSNYEKLSILIAFTDGWIGLYELTQREHKHFHPSGDPLPSKKDISITERIEESRHILGIKLIDHIIIGNDLYCSLKERGIIWKKSMI